MALRVPDVYLHPLVEGSLARRARAAWLWSHREGVLAGITASAPHGAKWVDDDLPIELVWPNARPPNGIRTQDYRLSADEFVAVADLATRHRGARGLRRLAVALDLHDRGAESPRETWLRLLLMRAGFPRPRTQIPVPGPDGTPRYYLDMGWEDLMVAVEYDGEHHRTDRPSYLNGILRSEHLASVRWTVVRVVAGHRLREIVHRVHDARTSKLR